MATAAAALQWARQQEGLGHLPTPAWASCQAGEGFPGADKCITETSWLSWFRAGLVASVKVHNSPGQERASLLCCAGAVSCNSPQSPCDWRFSCCLQNPFMKIERETVFCCCCFFSPSLNLCNTAAYRRAFCVLASQVLRMVWD